MPVALRSRVRGSMPVSLGSVEPLGGVAHRRAAMARAALSAACRRERWPRAAAAASKAAAAAPVARARAGTRRVPEVSGAIESSSDITATSMRGSTKVPTPPICVMPT